MATDCRLLQEDGFLILQEDGSSDILLDGCPAVATSPPGGSGRAANPRAQAMREAEQLRRLELLREDEEILVLIS